MASLIERLDRVIRIQSALRSTLQVEDIHSIILATLISREGFDFSRAMMLEYDPAAGLLRGVAALGAPDRQQHERLQREIRKEQTTLDDMVRDLSGLESGVAGEESIFRRSLRDLSNHSFWITTSQIYGRVGQCQEVLRRIEIPYRHDAEAPAPTPAARLLHEIVESPSARLLTREAVAAAGLPTDLLDLLADQSLWMTLRTQKGLRLVLFVDKLFQDVPLEPIDVIHMDWFCGQASMGLEIAEIHRDLEQAYKGLQELDHMKSNFLATVSHELRTPLTSINGYVQLLLGNKLGPLSPGQREALERVIEHSEMLTGKVNDLIEIAELEMAEVAEILLEPIDPLNALIAILPRVETRRARKRITIEPLVDHAIPRIRGNAPSLERIFLHLLDNALKFSREEGHVRIEFREQGENLSIAVSDDGIGISGNQMQKIFDAFYQVDNQLTRSYAGMGIGLTVIKRQLDVTGGQIQVRSEPGQGSTFTIVYPLA